jgi:hypothetical protein
MSLGRFGHIGVLPVLPTKITAIALPPNVR